MLPPERELAEAMGVGRSTLRKTLKILRDRGLIDLDWGNRRYVLQGPDPKHCVIAIRDQILWLIQVSESTMADVWAVTIRIEYLKDREARTG
jgi:DNA-binding FadR family transcriptional regulator